MRCNTPNPAVSYKLTHTPTTPKTAVWCLVEIFTNEHQNVREIKDESHSGLTCDLNFKCLTSSKINKRDFLARSILLFFVLHIKHVKSTTRLSLMSIRESVYNVGSWYDKATRRIMAAEIWQCISIPHPTAINQRGGAEG